MNARPASRTLMFVAAVALAAVGVWYALSGACFMPGSEPPERAHVPEPGQAMAPAATGELAQGAAPEPGPGPAAKGRPETPEGRVLRGRMADEAARRRLEHAIEAARTRRESSGAAPAAEAEAATLDKDYIQGVVREAVPLLAECYELARHTTPELEGKLTLEFRIAGEPEVGGLVEEARVVEDTEMGRHPVLVECVQETILSLEFTAPEGGGSVMVRYPFVFHSDAGGE